MAGLLDIFGGGSADPYDIYGDLFTEKQKAAMRSQQQGQGLLRMAGAFADAAMPSRTPIPFGAAIGKAAAALGSGQDAQMEQMLNAAKTAELVRQSQQTRAMQKQFEPLYAEVLRRIRGQGGLGAPATTAAAAPTGVAALPSAPATTTPFSLPEVPSFGGALGAAPAAAGGPPGAGASLDNDPMQLAGLLATPDAGALAQLAAGGPDQVVGQGPGQLQGLLSAAYAPGGGANGRLPFGQDDGTPTVRLASAALAPYAIGNAVMGGPSSVEGVSDALSQKITDMVAKMPPDIAARFKIISGYRDAARQAQVNPGAPNSRHGAGTGPPGTGMAVDLQSDPAVLDWITQNPQYGVGFPLAADPKERNHLEMLTAEGARLGGSARRGGRFGGMGPDAGGGGGQDPALGELAALSALTGLLGVPGFPDISSFLKSISGSGSSVAPSNSGDVLDSVIAPLESGNRNIMQQVVGPGGGYNPSVGRVTGPSSAGGYYQITNSTWQDTAPKAGVDLARYPTAISAPREVQKQVAQQLLDTGGLQPWADFNPAVAAATGYRRGGRFAGMGPGAGGGAGGGETDLTGLLQLMSGPGGLSLPQMSGGGLGSAPAAASALGVGPAAAIPDARLIAQIPRGAAAAPASPAAPAAAPSPAPPSVGIPGLPTLPGMPPAPGMPPGVTPGAGMIPGLGVSPQELAVLNAMAETAKLGTPFKSLLDTYYQSPAYKAEVERATKGVGLEYAEPIAAATARGQAPYTAVQAQYQAALDITKKQIEQAGDAATQIVDIKAPDGKGGVQTIQGSRAQAIAYANGLPVPALGLAGRLPGAGPVGVPVLSPEETAIQQERGKVSQEMREVQVWTPTGPVTQPMTNQEIDARRALASRRGPGGPPQVGDIVDKPVMRPEEQKIADALGEDFIALRRQALTADKTIRDTQNLRSKLDSGMFTGLDANLNLFLARLGDTLGWKNLSDPEKIKNTQTYIAGLGSEVLSMVKDLRPASNLDLQFTSNMAGGQNLSPASIRQLLDMREEYARLAIQRHNEEAAIRNPEIFRGTRRELPMPPAYQPKEMTTPGGNRATINR